jgi:hypothetical protein
MFKIIKWILILTFLSSPLYSDEFTYHCDRDSDDFSMVFDVNRFEKTVVHTHSIFKESNNVIDVNKSREIYYWDEENNSVWFLNYRDGFSKFEEKYFREFMKPFSPPQLSMTLLNFERKKLFHQSMYNVTPVSGEYFKDKSPFSNSTYDCYILE